LRPLPQIVTLFLVGLTLYLNVDQFYLDAVTAHLDALLLSTVTQMQLAATYEDTDEKAHEILVSEAQMLGTGASFFKRISRSNVDDELQQQQQSGQDDVNFCVDHRLPADMSYDTTVDSVSTSAMGNRIRFISCLDDTRISNGHVVSANDEQATVGDCGVDCSTTQRASNAVEFFAGAADSGVEAVCTENGPVADGVEQTVVIENSAVEHVTSDSIIRHELVSDVFPEVCSSRRGSGDRNKDDVDDGDGCRLAVAEDGVMSDVATTTMPHEAESGVIIIRTQAMDDDEGQGHACHGMTMDGDEAANDSSSITRCSSSDGLVDRSTTPVDGDGDADLSINGDDCCHTGSVGQFPHPAAEPPSSDDRLCGAEHDLCIVDKFPDGFDAAACASDVLVNEPCR
jgi:hypothetical protein